MTWRWQTARGIGKSARSPVRAPREEDKDRTLELLAHDGRPLALAFVPPPPFELIRQLAQPSPHALPLALGPLALLSRELRVVVRRLELVDEFGHLSLEGRLGARKLDLEVGDLGGEGTGVGFTRGKGRPELVDRPLSLTL